MEEKQMRIDYEHIAQECKERLTKSAPREYIYYYEWPYLKKGNFPFGLPREIDNTMTLLFRFHSEECLVDLEQLDTTPLVGFLKDINGSAEHGTEADVERLRERGWQRIREALSYIWGG